MIKAIFVDVSGVLIVNQLSEIYARYEKEHLITRQTFRDVFLFLSEKNRTASELNEYLKKIKLDKSIWENFFSEFFTSEGRNEPLTEILKSARQKGIVIVITSNNATRLEPLLAKLGLSDLPDLIIASADLGLVKPDPVFWRFAFGKTKEIISDLKPEEVLVIDDHVENLDSARAEGFQTVNYLGDKTAAHEALRSILVI